MITHSHPQHKHIHQSHWGWHNVNKKTQHNAQPLLLLIRQTGDSGEVDLLLYVHRITSRFIEYDFELLYTKPNQGEITPSVPCLQRPCPTLICIHTQAHKHTHAHICTHLWVLIHLLAVGSGDFPRGCWTVSLALLLLPFLCCILFVPLLVKITQKDIGFLCHNNLFRGVFTCWEIHWRPTIRCFTNGVRMKPTEVALVVNWKSF